MGQLAVKLLYGSMVMFACFRTSLTNALLTAIGRPTARHNLFQRSVRYKYPSNQCTYYYRLSSSVIGAAAKDTPDRSDSSSTTNSATAAPCFQRHHHLTEIDRVFCLSDLHTDHVDNLQWLRDRVVASTLSDRDLVIVAGDISHEFKTFQTSLNILLSCGCAVFFVPGNHEAWLNRKERHHLFASSLDKLDCLYNLCREQKRGRVYVDPVFVDGPHPLWILPLESWYDGTLSFDEELCQGFGT